MITGRSTTARATVATLVALAAVATLAAEAARTSDAPQLVLGGGALAAVVVTVAVWLLLVRPAQRDLAELESSAAGLARGELTAVRPTDRTDEAGRALTALGDVQRVLADLIAQMNHMSAEHEKGDIDVVIDADRFPGEFAAMAHGVNDMVGAHIAVKKKAMAVVKAFGDGDFDYPLEKLPGKKAFINDTVEQVRTNLRALVEDATTLSDAAVAGRLDVRADASRHAGGFRRIVDGVNATLDTIVAPLAVAIETANDIAAAARTLSSASQALSQATTEQAATVEETGASMEQMVASIAQNSENAKATESIATKAAGDAAAGGQAVRETVEAMKEIAAKIAIVDDIAFQTNMLALNATIEAARAGEHGKGFAVVATEVGKLAERSQVAAAEIGRLAEASVRTAEHAGALLEEIVPSIRRTSDLVQEIAAASAEQTAGAAQVNSATSQMTTTTQSNASASEELAATAEELSERSARLQQTTARFVVGTARPGAAGAQGHPTAAAPVFPETDATPLPPMPRAAPATFSDGAFGTLDGSKFVRF